ncbi:Protein of unknown function (DUF3000) [Flavimobilis soli]|uniref:DUF3000 family protein n=1 Tax=Flavimobilis soli TaxID=442709 RepID=A0A2A9E9C3_9MICO|nr:DUF3000 family protein [Flavimobilis soli]PFG35538.1 Protein of unknown function (DUF3000) [Flavimobilis soli]
MVSSAVTDVPAPFARALGTLRDAARNLRVQVKEVPAPRAARFSVALEGTLPDPDDDAHELADGTFVVLFDPPTVGDADGSFKVIVLVRAELDAEMSVDPVLSEVAWAWLTESLTRFTGPVDALGGSVTRTITTSHGAVSSRPGTVELELRASWAPQTPDLSGHLEAWAHVMRSCAGLPDVPEGVAVLPGRS